MPAVIQQEASSAFKGALMVRSSRPAVGALCRDGQSEPAVRAVIVLLLFVALHH